MSLFELWSGPIKIPALSPTKQKVGANTISHIPMNTFTVAATLYDDQLVGYCVFKTELRAPFDAIYLRHKGARRREVDRGVLVLVEDKAPTKWTSSTEFAWDDITALVAAFDTPEKIRQSWCDAFAFRVADPKTSLDGLRPPQVGALHAISAHFAVGKNHEPATIVLPTGTGKTETMLASLVYSRPTRLLVLVPSIVLRTQIAEKFESLGLLRQFGCIPDDLFNPKVAWLKSGIRSVAEAEQLVSDSNVIVALPNTLEASDPSAATYLCKQCEELFVDEAHHVSAATWLKIRDRFVGKKVTQFTATPFRNDHRHIGGRIIFNYKLSDAQSDGYYKPIRLETVEEFGDQSQRDRVIAMRAVEILRTDREDDGHDHLLLARVKNKDKAEEIVALYREVAPDLHPVVVYAERGKMQNAAAFDSLKIKASDSAKIVVCVNMLGEGFDLPQLKVAAVHDNHKSLAVTLQFVGRFTRYGENVGDAAVVINIADTNAEKRLEELYSEGADWDHLISRLSETQIGDELQLQDVIESLKSSGDLHDKISLWNLHPTLSTQVYRTNCDNWSPLRFRDTFPKEAQLWHSVSQKEHVLVVVGYQEFPVKWGRYENLLETSYDLLIAYWVKDNAALFVHASDYDRMRVSQVAQRITSEKTVPLTGPQVFNVLNNVELPLAKSLGSSRIGAISFTSYFGPNVTEGLASIEMSESQLNHIACLGYEDGDKVLWGAAQKKGKIWQQKSGSINDWINWCKGTYTKLSDVTGDNANITRDFLRPLKLENLYSAPPISAQWGEYFQSSFSDYLAVLFGDEEVPLYRADIELLDLDGLDTIQFAIISEIHRSTYTFKINPSLDKGYGYERLDGPPVSFRINRNSVRTFDEQMYVDPFIFRYADGTFSYNNFHIPFDLGAGNYSADHIEVWDWNGIPLNNESMGLSRNTATIQYRAFEMIQDEFPLIFNDDGPGEAGDLVAFREISADEIALCLVHCKNAIDGKVSRDIRNLYTVCGQAQKSITVKHEGMKKLAIDLRRRHESWAKRGGSRILNGDLKTLSYFVEKSRKAVVKFQVMIVQPGISKKGLSTDMAKLLATTDLFLKRTTDAEFRVVGSN